MDAKIPLKTKKLPNNVLTKDNNVFVVDKIIKFTNVKLNVIMVKSL